MCWNGFEPQRHGGYRGWTHSLRLGAGLAEGWPRGRGKPPFENDKLSGGGQEGVGVFGGGAGARQDLLEHHSGPIDIGGGCGVP